MLTDLETIFTLDPKAKILSLEGTRSFPPNASLPTRMLTDSEYPLQEGRGIYIPIPNMGGRYYYVKGAGNRDALISSESSSDWRKFKGIGHQDLSQYFFDQSDVAPSNTHDLPRVRGALSLSAAVAEFVIADVFYKTLCRKFKISDIDTARYHGLTIPVLVIDSPSISKEIQSAISKLGIASNGDSEDLNYGMVVLEVPGHERLRTRRHICTTKRNFYKEILSSENKLKMVGRTLRQQLACGFISTSPHYQNIYNASNSICPLADHIDLVPISEVIRIASKKEFASTYLPSNFPNKDLIPLIIIRQFEYIPFSLLNIHDREINDLALTASHIILKELFRNDWDFTDTLCLCSSFRDNPYDTLKRLAAKMLNQDMIDISAQTDWSKLKRKYKKYGLRDFIEENTIKVIDRSLLLKQQLTGI